MGGTLKVQKKDMQGKGCLKLLYCYRCHMHTTCRIIYNEVEAYRLHTDNANRKFKDTTSLLGLHASKPRTCTLGSSDILKTEWHM